MYKQTIPTPPCQLTNLHVLQPHVVSSFPLLCYFSPILRVLYILSRLIPFSRSSLPGHSAPLSRFPSPWSIHCCPITPSLTMLAKTFSPHCFPSFLPEAHATASFYFILSRSSFSTLSFCFSAPPPQRSAVFSLTFNYQSTVNIDVPTSRSVHIHIPSINPPSMLFSFFSFPLFASPQCKSIPSCYRYRRTHMEWTSRSTPPSPPLVYFHVARIRPVGSFMYWRFLLCRGSTIHEASRSQIESASTTKLRSSAFESGGTHAALGWARRAACSYGPENWITKLFTRIQFYQYVKYFFSLRTTEMRTKEGWPFKEDGYKEKKPSSNRREKETGGTDRKVIKISRED